jgi:hypothetical protein
MLSADPVMTESACLDLGQRDGSSRVGRESAQLLGLAAIVSHERHHGSIARNDRP